MFPNTNLHKKIQRFTDIRVIGLLMFGVVVLLVTWSSIRILQVNYELQKKEAILRQKNQVKKLENENLKLRNTYFETDEYLELTARRQFNKAGSGEKLYLIPKEVALSKTVDLPKTEEKTSEVKASTKSRYQQNFDAWLDFLLHRG